MADLNSLSITGNLSKDAEYKTLPSGKGVLECSVACNTGYGDYKKTLWLKVQQWGESGKKIQQYLKRGIKIACCGELQLQEWESKQDGTVHTTAILNTMSIQIISKKENSSGSSTSPYTEDSSEEASDYPSF